jgi:hypothetical protein
LYLYSILAYSLTAYNTVLLEKLVGSQLVKKFLTFYGTRNFITAFTITSHLSLFYALQLKKKHGKTSGRVAKTSVRVAKTSVSVAKTSVRIAKTSVRVAKTSV